MPSPNEEKKKETQWALLELFGHSTIVGRFSETEIAGEGFVRIYVPDSPSAFGFTRLYGPKAIYSITFLTEEVARALAQDSEQRPFYVYSPTLRRMLESGRNEKDPMPDVDCGDPPKDDIDDIPF